MSAVSNRVMPRSIALWMTLREVSRSVRWPKLLQPRPTAETRRPEPPRLRICIDGTRKAEEDRIVACRVCACKVRSGRARAETTQATHSLQKRCGPGQTRRLTGAAGALDL